MNTKKIQISEYDYCLPEDRIAKFARTRRDSSKLLVYNKGKVSEDVFHNITNYLPSGSLMIFNNTKVIQARMHFRKPTGALIEVFLLEPYSPSDYELMFQSDHECEWLCLVGNLKKWKDGVLSREVTVNGHTVQFKVTYCGEHNTSHRIRFEWNPCVCSFAEILDNAGELPIPPYLNRDTEESDKTTYQTVYSKIKGSVAAPTAGLHFTDDVLRDIDAHGVRRMELTLHVGAGTFKPVKSDVIEGHEMHTEFISVPKSVILALIDNGCKATAVGTTSVRTIESLYYIGCSLMKTHDEASLHVSQWTPYDTQTSVEPAIALREIINYLDENGQNTLHGSTQIIIAPGYKYKIVNRLITNFHQPKSTLLLLVSAFVKGDWRRIYDYALSHGFRFLSYGDSSLIIP